MKKSSRIGLVSLLSFCLVPMLAVDTFVSSPSCHKPYKPYDFTDQWQVDNFNSEVQHYKSCIEGFVDDQNSAIRRHEQAAEEAVEGRNRFVRNELNQPETP